MRKLQIFLGDVREYLGVIAENKKLVKAGLDVLCDDVDEAYREKIMKKIRAKIALQGWEREKLENGALRELV